MDEYIDKYLKIILALLLLACLLDMPYGYYEFVRFIAMAGFGVLAYYSYKENNETVVIIYIVLALLFQPFFKIALGRTLWNILDIVVAIGLFISILNRRKPSN